VARAGRANEFVVLTEGWQGTGPKTGCGCRAKGGERLAGKKFREALAATPLPGCFRNRNTGARPSNRCRRLCITGKRRIGGRNLLPPRRDLAGLYQVKEERGRKCLLLLSIRRMAGRHGLAAAAALRRNLSHGG